MVYSSVVNVGWIVHLVTCFYIIRPARQTLVRIILTCMPCIVLTYIGARSLPPHHIFSVFAITVYWMVSIRLVHFTVLSPDKLLTFPSFALKCLWILFPIIPCQPVEHQWSITFYLISGVVKFVLNCWLHRWLLICEANDNYIRVIIYFLSILTFSYVIDIQTVLVRIITRDKYTLQWLNNFPFLSQSIREFWGRRYNQLIGTILKESVFRPLSPYISSRLVAALITFIISGLFHVHIAVVVFGDVSSVLPTFACFFLNGIACSAEAHLPIKLPPLFGWLVTHSVLLMTAPMCLGPFARDKAVFFGVDALTFYGNQWIPPLPMQKICPT